MGTEKAAIRTLNDAFRRSFVGGSVTMTVGIAAIDENLRWLIIRRVMSFDAFTPDNDPHGEHDFGTFEELGFEVFWKIDYYTKDMSAGSNHPENPSQTARVLTIMLAEEY
jgi:hypothetical protein